MSAHPVYMVCLPAFKYVIWIGTAAAAIKVGMEPDPTQLASLAGWVLALLCRAAYDERTNQMRRIIEFMVDNGIADCDGRYLTLLNGDKDGSNEDRKDTE